MPRPTLFLSIIAFVLAQDAALAQTAQPSPQKPLPAAASISIPAPPPVTDPMLAPVPPPPHVLSSWQEAITYLRARSTDLRTAVDQVLQAEAQTRVALAQYLPTITASGSAVHQLITKGTGGAQAFNGSQFVSSSRQPLDTASATLSIQQDLFDVVEFDQISINELGEDAARLSVEDEKRVLALSVANQIVSVVTAEREAEINRVGLRVALEQAEITTRKQALGAANGLDVVRAEQNVANARATLVSGDETLREAREALGLALGVPEELGVAPGVNVDGLAKSAMDSCRAAATVDERSDVAAARVRLDVAKRNLRNVWFTFLPTVHVGSSVTVQSNLPSTYPNPTWNIAGTVSLPIWDGGTRYGNLRNADAAQDIAAQQLESLRRQAIIQVEQARRQLVVAQQSDEVARTQRDLAAKNDQMTQTAYVAGQGTSLELVTASEAHRQAEINLALADFNVVKAQILALLALATCPW